MKTTDIRKRLRQLISKPDQKAMKQITDVLKGLDSRSSLLAFLKEAETMALKSGTSMDYPPGWEKFSQPALRMMSRFVMYTYYKDFFKAHKKESVKLFKKLMEIE